MERIIKSLYLIVLIGFLGGCGGVFNPPEMGDKVSEFYTLPNEYQDHRDQQQHVMVEGHKIAFTDHGRGQPIVLLHGVPTSSWMYRKLIPELQQDMRVITIDLLGYGSSDKPEDDGHVYQDREQARRVLTVLDGLNVNEYALLMHDMGGLVAWDMLQAQADRVSNLIVLNTIINKKGFNHPNIEPGMFSRQLMNVYSSKMTSMAALEKTFSNMGLVNEYELSEKECFGYVEPMREGGDAALYAFFTGINDDLFKRLDQNKVIDERFKGNTLVLWGGKDKVLTTEQIPILQRDFRIPEENIHIYKENGHFLAEEIPQELGRKIKIFMGASEG